MTIRIVAATPIPITVHGMSALDNCWRPPRRSTRNKRGLRDEHPIGFAKLAYLASVLVDPPENSKRGKEPKNTTGRPATVHQDVGKTKQRIRRGLPTGRREVS